MIDRREIDGRRLACWMNDKGFQPGRKTLLFIHGSGGSHSDWTLQFTPLQALLNIAAIDLPGHGESEGPGEQDVASYALWIKKMLDGFGIEKPVLVGHSLGAAISLTFAIMYEDEAAAVVPVGGGARMPVNPAVLEGLKNDPAAVIGMAAKVAIAKENRERLSALITESLSRVSPEIFHGDLTACSKLNIAEAVRGIGIPALVICGTEDKMTPPALSESLRELIPGSGLSLIPEAGHFVMLEKPEAFNRSLVDFVNSLSR